ncbi:MAG: nucleotidyltransferase domain-containing protein [Rhodocyclaceae bacterium]|nr:nucleotidyltransferase domain-containing protein [Rhodocyclaceae bacterium]
MMKLRASTDPIPLPASPLKGEGLNSLPLQGEETNSLPFKGEETNSLPFKGEETNSLPFKGRVGEGMGYVFHTNLTNGGLPIHAADRMRTVFANHPAIEQIVLFGSRAKGNYKPASDIDLAVFGSLGDSELGNIGWELDDLLLPWEIDLIPFESISNVDLREHIAHVGQPFFIPSQQNSAIR